jgi:tryptophanyl-tRNA synthetase
MMTPLGWLERVPTYKDQQEKLAEQGSDDLRLPRLSAAAGADILIYRANQVPVGEDQVPHIEFTREIARRFNHIYGREPGFEDKARRRRRSWAARRPLYEELRTASSRKGDAGGARAGAGAARGGAEPLAGRPRAPVRLPRGRRQDDPAEPRGAADRGVEDAGAGWPEDVQVLRQHDHLREDRESVAKKIRTMPTDPARVRRTDPGEPEKCPVWQLHQVYSTTKCKEWVQQGCRTAGIGCLECKQPVIDAVLPSRRRCASARSLPRRSDAGAQHHRRRLREGARAGAGDHARRARGDGAGTTTDGRCRSDSSETMPRTHGARTSPSRPPQRRCSSRSPASTASRCRDAAGSVHPAGCAGGVPRDLRGAARPAAVPDPQGQTSTSSTSRWRR